MLVHCVWDSLQWGLLGKQLAYPFKMDDNKDPQNLTHNTIWIIGCVKGCQERLEHLFLSPFSIQILWMLPSIVNSGHEVKEIEATLNTAEHESAK